MMACDLQHQAHGRFGWEHAWQVARIKDARLWPMGDETVFIPGHGPESTFGEERRFNPYVKAG